MARKRDLCRAANGQFVRNIGRKKTDSGYSQPKFYLGRDEALARVTSVRLEQLWQQVNQRWQREQREVASSPKFQVHNHTTMTLQDGQWRPMEYLSLLWMGIVEQAKGDQEQSQAVWDDLTLQIADAVRCGEPVIKVAWSKTLNQTGADDFAAMSNWLSTLQDEITVIRIELIDADAQRRFDDEQQREAHRLVDLGRKMLHSKSGGESLHVAFEAYVKWIGTKYVTAEKQLSPWGGNQKRLVEFMKRHLPNCPLREMRTQRIEEHIDILRLRPPTMEGSPASVCWAKASIKQYRNFLKWLNRSEEFSWKRPLDLETELVRIPIGPNERATSVHSAQVKTHTPEELQLCWEYGTPLERIFMLLGLNCGFGRAEIASLEMDELFLHRKHPHEGEIECHSSDSDGWILRNRRKTGVYGEWKLWPETTTALEWWLCQRESIQVAAGVRTVFATKKGHRYDAPTKGNHPNYQIPNRWYALTARIQKDYPAFRKLSFKILRKSAGNMIRKASNGEIAGIFLCHGRPVKSDELLDFYTNRDFAKVFEAIDTVGQKLRPLWTSVRDPFPKVRKQGGPNITPGKIRRIQKLKQQGYDVNYIVEKVQVSRPTVLRWIEQINM